MKYKNKLKITRSLSFLLVVLLLLVQIPFSAMALEIEDENLTAALPNTEGQDNRSAGASSLLGIGEKSYAELQTLRVEDVVRPEVVTLAMAQEKGHVNRLTAQEQTLNSVMFQNLDGSKTAYVFSAPVKYVTANGDVRDKSTALTAQNGSAFAYAMTDNSVNVYFGAKLAWGGVKTVYDGNSVTLKPVTTANPSPTLGADGKSVTYAGAFGNGTALQYRTLLNGVKEDIVLNSNVGQSSFAFNMTLDGFTPELRDGVWCLLDDRDVAVLSLGRVLVKDSANNEVLGTMNVTANKLGGYTVTVTAPEDFLNDENTVYPVYIDPTVVTMHESYYYSGSEEEVRAIYDVAVYCDNITYMESRYNGWAPEYHRFGGSYADIYYQLPDFISNRGYGFASLNELEIGKVTFYVNLGAGVAGKLFVSAPQYDPGLDYENGPNAMEFNTAWGWLSDRYQTSTEVSADADTCALDITKIVRAWARYNAGETTDEWDNPACGFILSANFQGGRKLKAITEYSYADVYYTVDYETNVYAYYSDLAEDKFLKGIDGIPNDSDSSINTLGWLPLNGWNAMWIHDYRGNSNYYIGIEEGGNIKYLTYSNNNLTFSTTKQTLWKIHSADGGGVVMRCNEDGGCNERGGFNKALARVQQFDEKWSATETLLEVVNYNPNDDRCVWRRTVMSIYRPLISLEIEHSSSWIDVNETMPISILPTPSNASWQDASDYTIVSSNQRVAVFVPGQGIKGLANGYAVITAIHKQSGISDSFVLTVGQAIENGIYQIKNLQSDFFIGIEGASLSEGAYIEQKSYANYRSRWFFSYDSGYYSIQSCYSSKYMAVKESAITNGASIIQVNADTTSIPDNAKWKIIMTHSGGFKLVPKSAETQGMALSLPYTSTTDGVNLQQKNYTPDENYNDDWFVLYDAALLSIQISIEERDGYIEDSKQSLQTQPQADNILTRNAEYFTKNEMKTILESSSLFVIHTHGDADRFYIGNDTRYTIEDIAQTDLSNVKLMIFLTCSGAADNGEEYNLAEACIAAGADTVIAFSDVTGLDACVNWIQDLFEAMSDENELSLSEALTKIYESEEEEAYSYWNSDHSDKLHLKDIMCLYTQENGYGYDITLEDVLA